MGVHELPVQILPGTVFLENLLPYVVDSSAPMNGGLVGWWCSVRWQKSFMVPTRRRDRI